MNVDDVEFPRTIGSVATIGPTTSTVVNTQDSGDESRKAKWLNPRRTFTISVGPADVATVLGFFESQLGPRYGFKIRDWSDYTFTAETLTKVTVSSDTTCQLIKTYTTGSRSRVRNITLPDASSLIIKIDGTPTAAYTLGPDGVITMTGGVISGVITASGNFYVPVRFADDALVITVQKDGLLQIPQLNLIEITAGSVA